MLHCDVLMVDDNEKPVMGGPQVFLVLPRVGEEVVAKFRDSSYVCRVDSIRHMLWKVWAVNLRPVLPCLLRGFNAQRP